MARQSTGHGPASDGALLASWYASQPPITRNLLTASVFATLLHGLRLVSPYSLGLYWPIIWQKFQLWRLVTSFLVYSLSINGLIDLIMLYRYTIELERGEFAGRPADFTWFMVFCMVSMASVSWLTWTAFLGSGLMLSLATTWALHRREQIVTFYFGIKFPAQYLPYALMGMEFLLSHGNIPYAMVYGWAAAHFYYYLTVDLPSQGGLNYIPTPQIFYKWLGQPQRAGNGGSWSTRMATLQNPVHQRPGGGRNWGAGRSLNS